MTWAIGTSVMYDNDTIGVYEGLINNYYSVRWTRGDEDTHHYYLDRDYGGIEKTWRPL